MKITKKLFAMLLALVMVFSTVAISASALNNANLGVPTFQAKVISEDGTNVVVEFSLLKGNFASAEFTFTPQGNLKKIVSFTKADNLKAFIMDYDVSIASNINTGRLAFASPTPLEGRMSLYQITFEKKTGANLKASDLAINVTNCDSYVKASDTDNVTSKVTVSVVPMDYAIELDTYSLEMNYKKTQKINVDTKLDTSKLVWTSSNEKVATVDDQGNVTTVGTGNAVIKVATEDGSVFAECNVNSSYSTIQWIIVIVLFGWIWY